MSQSCHAVSCLIVLISSGAFGMRAQEAGEGQSYRQLVDAYRRRSGSAEQAVATLPHGELSDAVSMMLALDTSTSVDGELLRRLKEAAAAAVASLGETDRAALMTFAGAVTLRADWSARPTAISRALAGMRAGGTTPLYDAVFASLSVRDPVPGNRALIVLFSDGVDTSSWLPAQAALERARRSDAVVYVVTRRAPARETSLEYRSGVELWPRQPRSPAAAPFAVDLANPTGGNTFVARTAGGLRDVFTGIVSEFRTRYVLTYTPRGVAGSGWHTLDVNVKRPGATVRARRGYSR